jgi:hypothetical protein
MVPNAHISLTPNELLRQALRYGTTAPEQYARLPTEQGQSPVDLSPSVEAHEATSPATTLAVWRLLASDLATVNALAHRDHEQLSWMVAPHWQQLLDQLRAVKQRHRPTLSDLLTRIDCFAKAEIDYPERT